MSWWNPVDDIKHLAHDAKHLVSDAEHVGSKLAHDAFNIAKTTVKGAEKVGGDVIHTGEKVGSDLYHGNLLGAAEDLGKGAWQTGTDLGKTDLQIYDQASHTVLDLGEGVVKIGGDLNDVALDAISTVNPVLGYGMRLGEVFAESAVNTAVLQPLDGVSQLLSAGVHGLTGYKLPELELHITPDTQGLGIAGKIASYAGDAVGFIAPIMLTGGATSALAGLGAGADALEAADAVSTVARVAGDGSDAARVVEGGSDAARVAEDGSEVASTASKASRVSRFLNSPYKTAMDGAIAGFVFTPSKGGGNILTDRFEAAGINAATFGTMDGVSGVLSDAAGGLIGDTTSSVVRAGTHLAINAASGAVGGVANAESSSLLTGHGLASASEIEHSAGTYAITGTAFGGLQLASDHGFAAGATLRGRITGAGSDAGSPGGGGGSIESTTPSETGTPAATADASPPVTSDVSVSEDSKTREQPENDLTNNPQVTAITKRGLSTYTELLNAPESELNTPGAVVVDLGSGIEQNLAKDVRTSGLASTVVSLDPNIVSEKDGLVLPADQAARANGRANPESGTIAAKGDALPLQDGSADSVYALYSVPYYYSSDAAGEALTKSTLSEMMRVLKPDGTARVYPIWDRQVSTVQEALDATGAHYTLAQNPDQPEFFLLEATKPGSTVSSSEGAAPGDTTTTLTNQPEVDREASTTPTSADGVINDLTHAQNIESLTQAVVDASADADDPAVRTAVKGAVIDALNDKSMPFKEVRDLIDGKLGSKFDFVRTDHPDPQVVEALQARATYEVQQNPNVFTDNKAAIQKVLEDVRNGGDKTQLEKDVTNAIDPSLTPEEKAAALVMLAHENQPLLDDLFQKVNEQFGTESGSDIKRFENILNKAVRPSVLEKAEGRGFDFQVENIRDSVRGQITLDNLSDLPALMEMLQEEGKQNGFEVVKADTDMLLKPKLTGWRGANIDLRFENGQLGELSLRIKDIENVPDNHADYEFLRTADESSPEYQARLASIQKVFGDAWQRYLDRTGQSTDDIQQYLNQLKRLLQGNPQPATVG